MSKASQISRWLSKEIGSLEIGVVVVENVRSTFSTTTTENPGEPRNMDCHLTLAEISYPL